MFAVSDVSPISKQVGKSLFPVVVLEKLSEQNIKNFQSNGKVAEQKRKLSTSSKGASSTLLSLIKANTNPMEEMSEYEKMVKRRKAEGLEFLKSLGMDEVTNKLSQIAAARKCTPRRKLNIIKENTGVVRRSKRLQNVSPVSMQEENTGVRRSKRLENVPPVSMQEIEEENILVVKKKLEGPFDFKDVCLNPEETKVVPALVEVFSDMKWKENDEISSWYENNMHLMRTDETLIQKVVPTRIVDVAIHPSPDVSLIAAASKEGHLGFWDLKKRNSDNGGCSLYKPHNTRISWVKFNLHNCDEVYTSSFDGSVRCASLNKQRFTDVYRSAPDEDKLLSSFDFLSPNTFLVSQRDGFVIQVDNRTNNIHGEHSYEVHESSMKNISVHPEEKQYFLSVGKQGCMRLWDLRNMKKEKPLCEALHAKTVNSAYLSPVSGKYIVTTSMDHKLNIFEVAAGKREMSLRSSISHNNFTGRWLTPFRANWLPNSDNLFIVGCMQYPRSIEVYRVDGRLVHTFCAETLNSVCCINTFHPNKLLHAGGNSSGKIYVFGDGAVI